MWLTAKKRILHLHPSPTQWAQPKYIDGYGIIKIKRKFLNCVSTNFWLSDVSNSLELMPLYIRHANIFKKADLVFVKLKKLHSKQLYPSVFLNHLLSMNISRTFIKQKLAEGCAVGLTSYQPGLFCCPQAWWWRHFLALFWHHQSIWRFAGMNSHLRKGKRERGLSEISVEPEFHLFLLLAKLLHNLKIRANIDSGSSVVKILGYYQATITTKLPLLGSWLRPLILNC